ncbi:hypothetical protein GY21_08935 [Cryobacterium roopkundense]|uniref:Uridine kinase n=1 Tax=Cryobacterium roopkundense TaxID=1001240 RepID=A0A099JEI1_9MICO|nr:hypothetical protein [Cryobacterium roopkundense]KGJ76894.1 hypothetical protein GY21_08935 [Cryobacterium roopkundense]MBB5640244.1 uridine kinase [Cryobacterium roopkundense]
MRLPSTPRVEFLRSLANEILHNYGRGRTIVAVDGTDATGRARFADDLGAVLREDDERAVFRASLDFFQRSSAEKNRFGPGSAERDYRYGYDYSALRRVLLEPFRMDGSAGFVTEHFDAQRDTWIEPTWLTAPADAILVLDGRFVHRPELHGLWSFSVFLESDTRASESQAAADRLYVADASPRGRADAVVDTTNPALPSRVFSDSC